MFVWAVDSLLGRSRPDLENPREGFCGLSWDKPAENPKDSFGNCIEDFQSVVKRYFYIQGDVWKNLRETSTLSFP